MRRIERAGWWERAWRIRGIFIVATEPVAARRRWCFWSEWWSEAFRIGCGGEGLGLLVDGTGGIGCFGGIIKLKSKNAPTTRNIVINRSS